MKGKVLFLSKLSILSFSTTSGAYLKWFEDKKEQQKQNKTTP